MSTPKVNARPSAAAQLAKPTKAAPKVSFAETLSAQTGDAPKKAVQSRERPAPDPRERQLMDHLAQQQAQRTQEQLQSSLNLAKKSKNKKNEAKGGLEEGE